MFALYTSISWFLKGVPWNNSSITLILCKLARVTSVPSISTGSNTATGVRTPVLPIVHSIFINFDG